MHQQGMHQQGMQSKNQVEMRRHNNHITITTYSPALNAMFLFQRFIMVSRKLTTPKVSAKAMAFPGSTNDTRHNHHKSAWHLNVKQKTMQCDRKAQIHGTSTPSSAQICFRSCSWFPRQFMVRSQKNISQVKTPKHTLFG